MINILKIGRVWGWQCEKETAERKINKSTKIENQHLNSNKYTELLCNIEKEN